jgi:prepilin-type processing-associated H-X9-DG protein
MKFQMMSQLLGEDMSPLLLLMMRQGDGGMDGDFMGMMLMMKALAGAGKTAPAVAAVGTRLFIVEDGTVYVLDTTTLKLETSVQYRPPKKAGGVPADLLPMLQQAKDKALASSCLSNMKQLVLGALMYAQDWDEVLPGEEWAEQLQPYLKNPEIYKCPAAPDKEYGYALNEALAGAKLADIKRPAEVVLFFESGLPDDVPFGGPDGLLTEPHHAGMVTVGFVDGHTKLMKPDEAKKLLGQDPFQ